MSAIPGPEHFKANADAALADRTLKVAIDRTTGTAERRRGWRLTLSSRRPEQLSW